MLHTKHRLLEFSAMLFVGLALYSAHIYIVEGNSVYKYPIELWNYGSDLFNITYPLLFSLPVCWLLFHEKNSSYWTYLFNRTAWNTYIKKRILGAICMSAVAMFVICMASLLFAYSIAQQKFPGYEPSLVGMFAGDFQLIHPIRYALLLSVWRSILAILYTLFGIGMTMISKNIFIVLSGGLIYSIIENFVTAVLGHPAFSITTSFYPGRLSSDVISLSGLLFGPSLLLIIILLMHQYYRRKIKNTLMD